MKSHLKPKNSFGLLILMLLATSLWGQNPNWVAPISSNYVHTASGIYQFYLDDLPSDHANDRLAFFVGNELRGLSVPVLIGSQHLHFVTLYSNESAAEMSIKMYHHATNQVYESITKVGFTPNAIYGNIDLPMPVFGYVSGDAPVGIGNLPPMSTLQGEAFETIELANYLVQPDTNAVLWSFFPNPHVNVQLNGSILEIEPVSGYFGTTTLFVRVTEVSTNQKFSDAAIELTVDQAPESPLLSGIPNQGIMKGNQFTDFDLDDYEQQYNGTCLKYTYQPVIAPVVPTSPFPNWNVNTNWSSTMTFVVKGMFTPNHVFQNPGDRLALFTGDSLRAVSFPVLHEGSPLYFVSMGSNQSETEKIKIKFYSASMQKVFSLETDLTYKPFGEEGTIDNPLVYDFSPLIPSIDSFGNVNIEIRDTTWTGEQKFIFTVSDCKYPTFFNDNKVVSFCILGPGEMGSMFYFDGDGDGFGNPAISITACSMPAELWVDNNLDCNDSDPSTIKLEYTVAIQELAVIPNDGHICSGTSTALSITGGSSYMWSNGATTATILVNPDTTINYSVTITSSEGCTRDTIIPITVETNVITNNQNSGPGSIRSVLECVAENGDVYFDQPINDHVNVTGPIDISKNVRIIGLSPSIRPYISLDLGTNDTNIQLQTGKTLTLKDVDMIIKNQNGGKPCITGNGVLSVTGMSTVKQE